MLYLARVWRERATNALDELRLGPTTSLTSRTKQGLPLTDPLLGHDLVLQILDRFDVLRDAAQQTLESQRLEVQNVVGQFASWMSDGVPVRVLGAGRARLAAAIPANRLAHGGARVFVQDSEVPMPHTLHGGGLLAASASGQTEAVLNSLRSARRKNRDLLVIGIAATDAREFRSLCDTFIGIPPHSDLPPIRLSALADLQELLIAQILDALVVAAGVSIGYTDATWRLGHEDLGPTGPYDHTQARP